MLLLDDAMVDIFMEAVWMFWGVLRLGLEVFSKCASNEKLCDTFSKKGHVSTVEVQSTLEVRKPIIFILEAFYVLSAPISL